MNNEEALRQAADALRNAKCAIAVTGAGISVESGIPSFRGSDGVWAKYPPEEYATLQGYLDNPAKVWEFWCELGREVGDCKPHPAHHALAELEKRGLLEAVITQNIDNLHHDAGSKNVIEYHGNARSLRCLDCGATEPFDLKDVSPSPPRCPICRGLMKPDIVMFGEMIPVEALLRSRQLADTCEVVIIVGTSATVFPAAGIPYAAKEHGAFIIEFNVEPTAFTHSITDAYIEGRAGETMPKLIELL